MKRTLNFLLTVGMLMITAHRLPAPIQELPESPSPTPTVAPAVEPKPPPKPPPLPPTVAPAAESRKPLPKPKSTTEAQPSRDASLAKGAVHVMIHSDSDTRKIFTYFQYPQIHAPVGSSGLYRVEVNPDGTVAAVTILKSMGSETDITMMKAFTRWRAVQGPVRVVDIPWHTFEFYRAGPR